VCNGIPLRRLAVQYDYTQMWYLHNICAIYHEKSYILLRCVQKKKKQTKKKNNNNRLDFVLPRMIGYGMFGV